MNTDNTTTKIVNTNTVNTKGYQDTLQLRITVLLHLLSAFSPFFGARESTNVTLVDNGGHTKLSFSPPVTWSHTDTLFEVDCSFTNLQKTTTVVLQTPEETVLSTDNLPCEKISRTKTSSSTTLKMAENQMSTEDVMKFMRSFQENIEKTMHGIGNDISKRIEDKLTTLDKGLDNLTAEVRNNDTKHEENHAKLADLQEENMKKLEARLSKLETDAGRQKFARTKVNSKHLNVNTDEVFHREGYNQSRTDYIFHREGRDGRQTDRKRTDSIPTTNKDTTTEQADPLLLSPDNRIERTTSWAEEVELNAINNSPATAEDDRNQWQEDRRAPSNWAARLNSEVSGAADLAGTLGSHHRKCRKPEDHAPPARKPSDNHECKKDRIVKMHHWFGESSSEESGEEESNENWSRVDREGRNLARKKRSQDRMHKKMMELSLKARQMAGIGPIKDADINVHMRNTRDYSKAKIWAVKSHLARHYRYNQDELDNLEILETKRNSKDDIIYIAVSDERDVKDIYSRKAEVRSDNTTVKSFIPPQYFERFSALNRICAARREQDGNLKTQIRFGERDLMVLTKQKGSQDPYRMENLQSFVDGEELPPIDMSIRWKFNEDRPPRRRVATPSPDPANRQHAGTAVNPSASTTRQLSQSSSDELLNNKRRKLANQMSGFPADGKNDMDITQ